MTDDQLWWSALGGLALGVLFAVLGVFFMSVLMLGTGAGFWLALRRRRRIDESTWREIEDFANKKNRPQP